MIVQKLKNIALLTVLSLGLALPFFGGSAHALYSGAKDEACVTVGVGDGSGHCDQDKLKTSSQGLGGTVDKVINLLTIIVGLICVIMIIISGIRFVTAAGDSNQITSARNTFIYALVGLIIVGFAQIIVKLVLTKIA
ncbi:MAG TPA: pilin [Candidatus Saccharimonadales bacterium]|nr:pilin [Candidatus Saccharimonadales bacterium]